MNSKRCTRIFLYCLHTSIDDGHNYILSKSAIQLAVADVRQVADRQSSSNGDVGSSLQSSGQG